MCGAAGSTLTVSLLLFQLYQRAVVRAGDSFLLDGVVLRPDSPEYPADPSSRSQELSRSANGDALMPLPPSEQARSSAVRRGRGGGSNGGGAGDSGGVMLRVLGMSAQDTLGSLTGRAAAAEWARHQVRAQNQRCVDVTDRPGPTIVSSDAWRSRHYTG